MATETLIVIYHRCCLATGEVRAPGCKNINKTFCSSIRHYFELIWGGSFSQRKALFLTFGPSGCAALWKQNSVKDVTTLAWKTLWKVVSTWSFLTHVLMIILCGTRPKSICQWGLQTWAYLIWTVRKCPLVWWDQISISLSLSLLFMDGLSFRLMCKPDSYQSSCRNPVCNSVGESKVPPELELSSLWRHQWC